MECILLVDDDSKLRAVARQVLEQGGYHVLETGDPFDALQVAELSPRVIHLLLTDAVMPGMNGAALGERIRVRRPEAKVLLMSAVPQETLIAEGSLSPGSKFISKPFTGPDLRLKVREVLDQRSPFARPRH
jgi:CheY-like chemotaxis protein